MFRIDNLFGQRVEVYRDLRRGHNCWSLRSPTTKKVLNYQIKAGTRTKVRTQLVALRDCVFKVQKGGPPRVRRTGKKYVHAWVVGTLVRPEKIRRLCSARVTYNPFKLSTFVLAETPEITVASAAVALLEYPNVYVPTPSQRTIRANRPVKKRRPVGAPAN